MQMQLRTGLRHFIPPFGFGASFSCASDASDASNGSVRGLDDLPEEILLYVASFLTVKDVLNFSRTNKVKGGDHHRRGGHFPFPSSRFSIFIAWFVATTPSGSSWFWRRSSATAASWVGSLLFIDKIRNSPAIRISIVPSTLWTLFRPSCRDPPVPLDGESLQADLHASQDDGKKLVQRWVRPDEKVSTLPQPFLPSYFRWFHSGRSLSGQGQCVAAAQVSRVPTRKDRLRRRRDGRRRRLPLRPAPLRRGDVDRGHRGLALRPVGGPEKKEAPDAGLVDHH